MREDFKATDDFRKESTEKESVQYRKPISYSPE